MTEKTALLQAHHSSDSSEQDWENFQDAMQHILRFPKRLIPASDTKEQDAKTRAEVAPK